MPALSLVICLHGEQDLLARLLRDVEGCYDDLIVVHDGLEAGDQPFSQAVTEAGGLFFSRSRGFQQETHWPFAWSKAPHDWILRLDADEMPTAQLRDWLRAFREDDGPDDSISGYTCIWPLWDGQKVITRHWPAGRIFLFNRNRVRFFGMAEQVPFPDGRLESLPLVLEHRPARKSYGLGNLLARRQAYRWRRIIAHSLLGKPTDLPCWRWTDEQWPQIWEEIRRRPLWTGFRRLVIWPLRSLRDFWRHERKFLPAAAVSGGIHHCLIAIAYWQARRSVTKR